MSGWTTDSVDGHLARWAGSEGRTTIGRSDIVVDAVFTLGGLAYFLLAGFVAPWLELAYLTAALVVFVIAPRRATVITFEAPLAALPAIVSLAYRPTLGAIMIAWAAVMLLLDYQRFRWRLGNSANGIGHLFRRR